MRESPFVAGLIALLVAACNSDRIANQTPVRQTSPLAVATQGLEAAVVNGKGGKVDVCHREGNGGFHLINISANAVGAHLNHGDGLPGGLVPADPSKKFDAACGLVDAAVCPCRFTLEEIQDLNRQFGDLGTDYDFVSSNLVTQINSRSDVAERRVNRFLTFQAPGPDWAPPFVACVIRVWDPGFVVLHNVELPVTSKEAEACVEDLHDLGRVLGVR